MKRNFMLAKVATVSAAFLWLCSAGVAQDQQGSGTPKPPARAYGPIGVEGQSDQDQAPDAIRPDDRPLTGFQQPTIGSPIERHSFWEPAISYYNFIQSNAQSQGGGNSWTSTSYITGSVSLQENWSRSQLAVNYSGGGDFATDSKLGNGWFQQIGANQTFHWEKTQVTLLDEFSYLPQPEFGFGAGTGLALPGVGGSLGSGVTGLSPGLSPGQTIFTTTGPRYMNTGGAQVNYFLTARSSITLGGIVGILRFSNAGNIESNNYTGNAGFNYQLSRADSLGVVYRYNAYHYLGSPQAIGDQMFQVAYGRKITGRLALQLTAGPEISNFRKPLAAKASTQYVAGSGSAHLTYAFAHGSISGGYSHGVTGGSGVFLGATTDEVTGAASRRLSRVWDGNLHVGFAKNRNAETAHGVSGTGYNTVFGGGSVGRPLGRNANFTLGYTAYVETASSTICAGHNCGSSFTAHQISLGFSWHARPLVLR